MRKIIVVLLLIIAVGILGKALFFKAPEPVVIKPAPPVTINEEELSRFLYTWSEYLASPISRKDSKPLSFGMDEIPPRTVKWLEKRDWDAKRFFYVEERLISIVKFIQIRNLTKKNVEVLKLQLDNEKNKKEKDRNPASIYNLQKLIEEQSQSLNMGSFSEEEIRLISNHIDAIKKILEGKAKL